ncbi:MAG TPA: hypothetical protein VG223_01340 [Solirubrobacteraceae bacterium]|nr:hypothetical protein [Solirubrobacteraceae bacterium]
MKGFVAVTARDDAWPAARIPVVADDVRHKHELMAGSPFVLQLLPLSAGVRAAVARAGSRPTRPGWSSPRCAASTTRPRCCATWAPSRPTCISRDHVAWAARYASLREELR